MSQATELARHCCEECDVQRTQTSTFTLHTHPTQCWHASAIDITSSDSEQAWSRSDKMHEVRYIIHLLQHLLTHPMRQQAWVESCDQASIGGNERITEVSQQQQDPILGQEPPPPPPPLLPPDGGEPLLPPPPEKPEVIALVAAVVPILIAAFLHSYRMLSRDVCPAVHRPCWVRSHEVPKDRNREGALAEAGMHKAVCLECLNPLCMSG